MQRNNSHVKSFVTHNLNNGRTDPKNIFTTAKPPHLSFLTTFLLILTVCTRNGIVRVITAHFYYDENPAVLWASGFITPSHDLPAPSLPTLLMIHANIRKKRPTSYRNVFTFLFGLCRDVNNLQPAVLVLAAVRMTTRQA